MRAAGIPITEPLIADGILHRYHVNGDHPSKRNAWAAQWIDDHPAGVFGCHKRFGGETLKWSAEGTVQLTRQERRALAAKIKADQERRANALREVHAAAAIKANAIWDAATPCEDHPYLRRKGVKSYGLRVGDWIKEFVIPETGEIRTTRVSGALLIPIRNSFGQIVSLQAIFQ